MDSFQALYPEVSTERFAWNVKACMKAKHLTVSELQQMIPVGSVQTIYKWLNGKSIPEYATLCALARIFEVSIETLLDPIFHNENTRPDQRNADRGVVYMF